MNVSKSLTSAFCSVFASVLIGCAPSSAVRTEATEERLEEATEEPWATLTGIWEGELRVVHGPDLPDRTDTITYRITFSGRNLRVELPQVPTQLSGTLRSIQLGPTHYAFSISQQRAGWFEEFYITLIITSPDDLFVYSNRVVDNFQVPNTSAVRHFSVITEGPMQKVR